jgi:hypothetical protein
MTIKKRFVIVERAIPAVPEFFLVVNFFSDDN